MNFLERLTRDVQNVGRAVQRQAQQIPTALRGAAHAVTQTITAPLRRPAATTDGFDGVRRATTPARPRAPALPEPASSRPAGPLQTVAQWGRQLSGTAQGLDRFFVAQMDRSERALGRHDLARAGSGFGHGVTSLVTGTMELAGGALQLADPSQRAAAGRTVSALAANPGAAVGAVRDQVVQSWQRDPARFVGGVVANLVPVGAAVGAVSRSGRAAPVAAGAGRVARGLTPATTAARTAAPVVDDVVVIAPAAARAITTTSPFPPLRSAGDYAALVTRQTAEGSVDLTGLARPGIARFDSKSGTYAVVQGAGRAEKARPDELLDLFVERGSPLPAGAVRAEVDVAGSLVADANILSSRGAAGASPELVQFVTDGKVFDRVFVPRRAVDVPTSTLAYEIRQGVAALEQRLGADGARATLDAQRFADLAIVEQRAFLGTLGVLP